MGHINCGKCDTRPGHRGEASERGRFDPARPGGSRLEEAPSELRPTRGRRPEQACSEPPRGMAQLSVARMRPSVFVQRLRDLGGDGALVGVEHIDHEIPPRDAEVGHAVAERLDHVQASEVLRLGEVEARRALLQHPAGDHVRRIVHGADLMHKQRLKLHGIHEGLPAPANDGGA